MRLFRFALAVVILQMFAGSAVAQDVVQKSFPVQLFEPAIGTHDNFFSIESASVAHHLGFGVGLLFNYQHRPLVLFTRTIQGTGGSEFNLDQTTEVEIVKNHLTANIHGVFGLHFKWLHAQIGLDLPVDLIIFGNEVNKAGEQVAELSGAGGLGDLRMQIKVQLLPDWNGLSIAFSPILTFPTAGGNDYGGDPNVTFRPRIVLDYNYKNDLIAAINFGWLVRESTLYFSSEIGHRMLYGAALGYRVHKRIFVMAEVFGQAGFDTQSDCRQDPVTGDPVCDSSSAIDLDAFPLELLFGGNINVARGFDVTVGAGFGLIKAVGSPNFRVIAGLRWAPDFKDTDNDGVYDYNDKCPTQAEDKDQYKDQDGCPDPDNDGDLIPDMRDKCPNKAEDKDGFKDEDGCPDDDNDGDGIVDIKDSCPFKAETVNGYKDKDGCPDSPDKDGDGVPDTKDKCPDDPEDMDSFEDEDGCPDPDNDKDQVPDNLDDCPLKPEDVDGFKDDDGCPDEDNDGDGVLDVKDKCPNKPETINGYKDQDGCPDKGKAHVIIKKNKIVITKKVYFATGRTKIRKRSHSILNEVALVLLANTQIKGIRVEGHTDSRGKAAFNKKLSQGRAEAVREYLIKRGVDHARLFAVGYGPEKPIEDNRTSKGRAANRRVEFTILEQAPGK